MSGLQVEGEPAVSPANEYAFMEGTASLMEIDAIKQMRILIWRQK